MNAINVAVAVIYIHNRTYMVDAIMYCGVCIYNRIICLKYVKKSLHF